MNTLALQLSAQRPVVGELALRDSCVACLAALGLALLAAAALRLLREPVPVVTRPDIHR